MLLWDVTFATSHAPMIERYPVTTALSLDALDTSGWRDSLAAAKRGGYSAMWSALSTSARAATDANEYPKARVLWLLADSCSMMLKPESPSDPFRPIVELAGGRSAMAADFPDDALTFMEEASSRIDDVLLRARLCDVVWVRRRSAALASLAIDTYLLVPIDVESWLRDGRDCWQRAIQLCHQLGRGSGDRLAKILDRLLASLSQVGPSDSYLAIWVANAIRDTGRHKDNAGVVAEALKTLAQEIGRQGDRRRSIDHWIEAGRWHAASDNKQMEAEAHVAAADTWMQLADDCAASGKRQHAEAAAHLESAIQTLRLVPRALRGSLSVESKIQDAHRRMTQFGELAVEEMGTIKSDPIDLTDWVQRARQGVQGKSVVEALRGLATVHRLADVGRDREFARQMVTDHPLSSLFAAKYLSSDGRVVAKVSGSGPGLQGADQDSPAVRAQMIRHHSMCIGLAVQGSILPALECLRAEHRIREVDFVAMARRSGIVPIGREGLIGKCLYFGLEGDWAGAVHVLVPQIEHIVRAHLKQAGSKTTTLDVRGIEQEVGLSSLMENPAVDQVLGPSVAWEIRALFCDNLGPNMRNEIAHGLVDDGIGNSVFACYAWWIMLRLVMTAFWTASGPTPAGSQPTAQADE